VDKPTIERFDGEAIELGNDDSGSAVTVEFAAIDPGTAFGPEPREFRAPDNGSDFAGRIDRDSGGSAGGEPGSGDDSGINDEYARNADGSVKRNRDGSPRRKSGRKRGGHSGSRGGSSPKSSASLAGIEASLLTISGILAIATKTPEIALEEDEAKAEAKAIAELAMLYPTTIDPKSLAWFNLTLTTAMIVFPRVSAVRQRRREERAANITPQALTTPPPPPQPNAPLPTDPQMDAPEASPTTATFTLQDPPRQRNAGDVPFRAPPGVIFAGLNNK
jgi:hypothetical protein